ncbi:hypothetical protein OSB04_024176 [Centaurea solstitialis]|uniref:Reverse transcriptase Ty1/copia-type domain-containing protein n=1 Tax=Centaurea solstitialis TaxID=347529 RepID=A0AA38SKL8_9ASTR|nr:hypothetical protein OSB04_024176 [Centaurea solstitialis]
MLSEANLDTQFWAEAVNTACYTQNRSLIVKRFRKTAYELFRNRKPSIEHFHIFGYVCYILNNKDNMGKFDSKSDDGIFLRYSSIFKTYRVVNKRRQSIEKTIHVRFDEPVPDVPIVDPSPQNPPDGFEELSIPPQIPVPAVIDATPITQVAPETDQPTSSEDMSSQPQSESAPAPTNLLVDPSNIEASTSGQDYSEHQRPALRWTKSHPIDQVLGNLTSGVKTRPQSCNICLYVNFYSEIEPKEIDDAMRDPAWALVDLESGIRTLSIVQNAKLLKAPHAWYDNLSTFLLSKGFERGKIDSTLFLKKYPKHIILLQIYVDDIIFGSTNPKLYEKFELLMKTEYKLSMMGELTYFLGIQIKQSEKGIFINQGKYVHDMLKKFHLTSCTPMKTLMAPPLLLDKDSNGKPIDVTLYRGMIGSLLYLTASRSDIMYSTCLCAHNQAEPKESHLTTVKRIFRYLKGTPNLGLWYAKDSGFDLNAYSDSDFAGCKIDTKNTTGGCQLLGGKLVSWISNVVPDSSSNQHAIK